MPIICATDKKKALLALKEKLKTDITYYENRITQDLRVNDSVPHNFEDSSESEDECLFSTDNGPMENQLKTQQKMFQTSLHATQELASLMVLQSRVDVMVEDPVIEGEPPVTTLGLWKEVNADGHIDLVPFSIMFYIHQANGLFGSKSYRSLKVVPVKPAQEVELTKSVLTKVRSPSDAVEVLRSYSIAYRSRRTTLARLADKFAHNLYMEPLPTGGYLLQCAGLMTISWMLENKWSSVAPFYHKMIFDLEHMDECYIKIIRYAHKQLVDPSIGTNERTILLSKIIATCLEAKGTQEPYESMESDTESMKNTEKKLSLENDAPEPKKNKNNRKNEIEDGNTKNNINNKNNANNKENIDDQIMAPPKSLPKKVKPKGKENNDHNRKAVKRSMIENETGNVKKAKTDKNNPNNVRQSEVENMTVDDQLLASVNINENKTNTNAKNKNKVVKSQNNSEKSAKVTEKDQTKKTEAMRDNNEKEDNAENVKSNKKVPKNHNTKDKNYQNNEKVTIVQKPKVTKSKNPEENSNKDKNDIQSDYVDQNVNAQKKPKKKVVKDMVSQKESNNDKGVTNLNQNDTKAKNSEPTKTANDKIVSEAKNDPKAKYSEIKKTANKVVTTKNDANIKNSDTQKQTSNDKMIATSKNDPKTKESTKEIESNNEKFDSPENVEITTKTNSKSRTDSAKLVGMDDIPIISVNNNIDTVPKTAKQQNFASKNTNTTAKRSNKDVKKTNKDFRNTKVNNFDASNKNKESNARNAKQPIVKDTKSNTNPYIGKDKHCQKNIINNTEEENTQKSPKNNEKNEEKTNQNQQESNVQKLKTTKQKVPDKNTANKEMVTKNAKNNENTDNLRIVNEKSSKTNLGTAKNHKQQHKDVITEKVAELINVATKNKEHTTNIAKKTAKPKMVIKTLTHKNIAASKKVGEKLNNFAKIKKIKSNNKISKTKENDSGSRISKIPMKLSIHESLKKKNPLRISPRKLPSTFKSSSESNIKQKNYFTNIPRLMKKTEPKKISK